MPADQTRRRSAELCAGAGCAGGTGDGPRPRAPGRGLCPPCAKALDRDLRALPGLYAECGRLLAGDHRTGPAGTRTTGGALPGMPFNAAAAEVRGAVLGTLSSWAGTVAQARGLPAPQRSVPKLCAFLLGHADWLTGCPAAADVSREVAHLVRTSWRVAGARGRRRVTVGRCTVPGCGGDLVAELSADGEAGSGTGGGEIRCAASPEHRWEGREWTRLAERMRAEHAPARQPAAVWLTTAEISRLWQIASGSVYRHASEQRWRRRRRAGRTQYFGGDVQATLGARGRSRGA
ncbi:hypothetical protein V1J52_19935 [Streptomyces sp. TRM 70351]|uniref:hypothetical protein n=1 Tax=Streptomyces sp. TRM 70351 TaxID=3116552 RepID=UPI002E7BE28D|nr:hypothetical protein [Streptomyces sp. TRM 70351]MEE1930426.1 hypothetical protein [Streptomyces sp. TRM 70351]